MVHRMGMRDYEGTDTDIEGTIRVREDVTEIMNNDFPVTTSSRNVATIHGNVN